MMYKAYTIDSTGLVVPFPTDKQISTYNFSAGYSAVLSAGTDEVAFVIKVRGGTIALNDTIEMYQSHSINNSVNTKSFCIYFSTISETIGAAISGSGIKIATLSGLTGAGGLSSGIQRHFVVRSTTSLIGIYQALSFGADTGLIGAATSAITIPTILNDIYICGTVNRANSGDTLTINTTQVKVIKSEQWQ